MPQNFKFCPHCAAPLDKREIQAVQRLVCSSCDFIFWQNPIVGVAVIIFDDEKRLLLGRRSRGPYRGQWCIPCGYVECDEHVRDAAQREFLEETGLEVALDEVFTVHSNFHNPKVQTVGIWFRGEIIGGTLKASDDLDAVTYVDLSTLGRYPLAFPTDTLVIKRLRDELAD